MRLIIVALPEKLIAILSMFEEIKGRNSMESNEEFDRRIASAERAHDWQQKGMEQHHRQIEAFALLGMKSPALVAAGGVAAALGFYSANYARLTADASNLTDFNSVLFWLFLGLLMTIAAPGLAYFSQLSYAASIAEKTFCWHHPFVDDTPRSRLYKKTGDVCRWSAVVLTTGSIASICLGGYHFLHLVNRI
ncbi:hypothetical protein [Ciceribacter sp. RN22]|uniref:hypothetical protein n=1 Tax=Ciceribacter sp. RN22 TaxID=2954932 RepID=UPI00209360A4|nr:hypothetical protein [Ciceribacter sp. RN22]MCO6177880.1 hypothetical protein [Ciceribacter sp. RN22]